MGESYGSHSRVKPGNEGGHLHLYINLTCTLHNTTQKYKITKMQNKKIQTKYEGGHLHLYINITCALPAKPGPTNQEFTRYNSLKGVHKVQLLKQFGRKVALNLLCDRCIVSSRMQSSVFARFGFSCRLIVVTPETDFCGCIM